MIQFVNWAVCYLIRWEGKAISYRDGQHQSPETIRLFPGPECDLSPILAITYLL